jgi:hypothetical protein
MFSHFQYLAYFIGVAKLPFRIPANNANPTAKGTFDIEGSSVIQKSETRNQESGVRSQKSEEERPPAATAARRLWHLTSGTSL